MHGAVLKAVPRAVLGMHRRALANVCSRSTIAIFGSVQSLKTNGSGSKILYQNGTLVSGNMDQHSRNPSCLILSHIQMLLA